MDHTTIKTDYKVTRRTRKGTRDVMHTSFGAMDNQVSITTHLYDDTLTHIRLSKADTKRLYNFLHEHLQKTVKEEPSNNQLTLKLK